MFPFSTSPRPPRLLQTDKQLDQQRSNNKFVRAESLQNHWNNLCILGMYAAGLGLVAMAALLIGHAALVQDWATILAWFKAALIFVGGYVMSYLRANGMNKD